ncbi:MotE family protein [Paenibacillus septentrionalis]|uniref:MotE family protein n=1 Tax=Paenibacillus septentrionalis TaxID=429342 RepID=A0ABW1V140_9BACL
MAATEEEKEGSSFVEKAALIATPVLFVIVLLGLFLNFSGVDIKNKALEIGQGIPGVRNILPEPSTSALSSDEQIRTEKFSERIVELETQLAALQNELNAATTKTLEQEELIATLQEQTNSPQTQAQAAVGNSLTDEEYTARIQELASMFARMTPSKAAPIVQSMTIEEMALIFSQMRADDRVRIMEKMTPQVAADVTLRLKDSETAKDMEIAALQAQVDKLQTAAGSGTATSQVSDADLAATFSSMEPAAAADMLMKMMDISSSKVLRILKVTGSAARSAILEEMSALNQNTTALLVTRLMED